MTLYNPDGTKAGAYNVTATSQDIAPYLPPGSTELTIPPDSDVYYRAIVQAFAQGTANTLRGGGGS